MPRPRRQIVPGGIYHITTRGNNRQAIFLDVEDRDRYLAFAAQAKEVFGFKLHLYVFMTNHVHLLVKTSLKPENSVPDIMKSLTLRYTKYFNKKYKRTGNIFQPKYFCAIVRTDSHALELTRYIHLNPLGRDLLKI